MKFLHTMLRVSNLDESIKFYVDILKLKLVRKSDYPHGKFTLAFLSYDINEEPFLELTYNWETNKYMYDKIAVDKFYKFLDNKDKDNIKNEIKDDIKLILYNNKID